MRLVTSANQRQDLIAKAEVAMRADDRVEAMNLMRMAEQWEPFLEDPEGEGGGVGATAAAAPAAAAPGAPGGGGGSSGGGAGSGAPDDHRPSIESAAATASASPLL